ncbi:HNH endonuclease signature motif containing protein [Lactobacillus sp. ESL0791]|uniref:HNH endonuclease signature motif containing protein n=1 Tax=Lactobacillus sp. ESL0791 TaxID=2983234 RepID=UPI0023F91EAD|nr:HNH endonuclease signature motif containing protein [Lactobacillus sp. ESL0791]MDF7639944.1 HNH endonuclease signature motif containing protein [Lactobacillus sp. ESL0791]
MTSQELENYRAEHVKMAFEFIAELPADHADWKMIQDDSLVPFYAISKDGIIKVFAYGRNKTHIVQQYKNNCGYMIVGLMGIDGKSHTKTVQQLVANAWLTKPGTNEKLEVDHINGNRTDNRVENLQWLTISQNRAKRRINNGYHGHKIIAVKDGVVKEYQSIHSASKATGISDSTVRAVADGYNTKTGFYFCYA